MKDILKFFLQIFVGSAILAFGLYNIHSFSRVTEGGILGITLLLNYWFGISPSVSTVFLNSLCYFVGYKILGKKFILTSVATTFLFSFFYRFFEHLPPIFPDIYNYPLIAAIAGAIFVGVGVGLCVRGGGAPGGDDALAMSLSHYYNVKIETVYIISDLIVLILSLSYIPFSRLIYSLLTVVLSGKIVGAVQRR